MKYNLIKKENSEIELEFELTKEELDGYINEAVLEFSENIQIEGFRKGKAPRNIIEERVGKDKILAEAADHAVNKSYTKAIEETKIEPISLPEAEVVKLAQGNPFIFKIKTAVLPEIALGDYRRIAGNVKREKVSVEEKEINDTLEWLKRSRARFVKKDEQAEKGDFVEIKYSSKDIPEINEEKVDGFILGEAQFIPGFEDKLIGLKTGETKEFSLDVHDHATETNKKADFKVEVINVSKVELPELNDQFALTLGKFENLEALKSNIKEGIGFEKELGESQRVRALIIEQVAKESKIEIPEILVKREQASMMDAFKSEVKEKTGISFEEYLKRTGKTENELLNSFKDEAEKRVRNFLVLREIGNKENIEAGEEEVKEEVNNALKRYSNSDKAQKDVDLERLRDYTRGVIKNEKTFKFLESLIK